MTTTQSVSLPEELYALSQAYLERAAHTDFQDPGLLQKASECLMMLLELEPGRLDAMMGLAYVSAQAGLFDRAKDLLLQAMHQHPGERRLTLLYQEVQRLAEQFPDATPQDGLLLENLVADIDFAKLPREFLRAQAEHLPELGSEGG